MKPRGALREGRFIINIIDQNLENGRRRVSSRNSLLL